MYPLDDTIAAIASPPGGAARGIVRLSGPRAMEILGEILERCGPEPDDNGTDRRVIAGSLRLPGLHSPLPCEVYLWSGRSRSVQAGVATTQHVRSYTGQPVVEIHTIGSPPLVERLLQSLCTAGARLAGPGEFTLRAFLAGRIDLIEAEAVLGVIDAADRRDLDVALGQLAGGLSRPVHRLRDELLDLLAHVEAGFDFADEDLAFITQEELDRRLAEGEQLAETILRQMASRGRTGHSVKAVLLGRPNTGKSSLFNAMAGDRPAIVSEQPGTTRDYLVAEMDLGGVRCQLIDTAGKRGDGKEERGEGLDIESAAELAAIAQRSTADIEVLCFDSTRALDAWEREQWQATSEKDRLFILTKCDAPRGTDLDIVAVETSSQTGQGIETLRDRLREKALGGHCDVVAGTATRCCQSLRLTVECLGRARYATKAGQEELAAAELRVALDELGRVTGVIHADDVLDRIFSRFCVGK